jgi:hypothetical protein
MKRITLTSLACTALLAATASTFVLDATAATPNPNSAVVKERIFNDCPFSTVTVVNNYPSLLSIEDAGLACSGFANLHNWTLSEDGVNGAAFDNNADFRISADLVISGTGNGESGIRISPWWSKDVDGRFNVRVPDGEIAAFGGRLPFYSFTSAHGLHYVRGETIYLEATYKPHGLNASSPATIEYRVTYQGQTYSSGALNFDEGNPAEDPPHGRWGMLNDGRVGGYLQAFMQPGNFASNVKATYSNIRFVICPIEPDPADAVTKERVFNDCPFTVLTVVNDYPNQISFNDAGLACSGFANMHVWTLSDDGRNETIFNNDDDFHIATDLVITGKGEGGLRVSPWFSHDVDGLFNVRSTDGEIACFGGRLPFYTFTGAHGLRYTPGETIRLGVTYRHNGLSAASPGTIQYDLTYQGVSYSSGPLSFDEGNPSEDPPRGRWGILNDARVGGHMKAFMTPGDFTATTNATFTNIVYESGVKATVDVDPNTLNLRAGGRFVTAYIEPEAPYAAADIDVHSLRLNGWTGPAAGTAVLGDHDGDGIADLAVKFPRMAVHESSGQSGEVTITGEVGGACFAGSDQVRIVAVRRPSSGEVVARGSTTTVRWEQVSGNSAAIHYSLDDGDSWMLVAEGLPNSGSYDWAVPDVQCATARIAVVVDDGTQEAAGISDRFSIDAVVGVGDGMITFALSGTVPNPSKGGAFNVRFSLPDGKRATLSLFDVSGRRLASREVGVMGAGRHTVTLAQRLPAGLYMVRLDREGMSLKSRAAVVR